MLVPSNFTDGLRPRGVGGQSSVEEVKGFDEVNALAMVIVAKGDCAMNGHKSVNATNEGSC